MGGRRRKFRELKPGLHIVGEGTTEYYYFKHLKHLFGYVYAIKPRFCKNTSIAEMARTIHQLMAEDVTIIYVFDADTQKRNQQEKKELNELKQRYRSNKNVHFCDSTPSIEYWFLIHFIQTRAASSSTVIAKLKKHLPNYQKTTKYLKNSGWVNQMAKEEGSMQKAREWAAGAKSDSPSYSNLHKAINVIEVSSK